MVGFAKVARRPRNTCRPYQFLIHSHSLGTGPPHSIWEWLSHLQLHSPTTKLQPKAGTQGTYSKVWRCSAVHAEKGPLGP